MPADFYFGSSTPDFESQHTVIGGSTGPTILVNTAGTTFTTPTGGIIITELARGMLSDPGYSGVTFPIGVYDITDGVTNAPLLVQATGNARTDNSGYVWHTVTGLNTFVPAGRVLAAASAPPSSGVWTTRSVDGTPYYDDGTAETTMPATWPGNGAGRIIPLQVGYSLAAPPPTLNNINTNNIVRVNSTGNTISTSGIATLTSLTIGGKAATSLNAPNGDGTFSMPGFTDEQVYSLMGTRSAVATDGTNSDNLNVTLLPANGWDYVTLAGTLNTGNTGTIFSFSPTAVVNDQIVFPLSHVVDAQGNLQTDVDGTVVFWHIQASTGVTRSFTVTTGVGAGDITPNSFNFTNLTNQSLSTLVESDVQTITGIDTATTVTITDGEYAINTGSGFGAFTSASGTVNNNNTIKVRRTTSASPSTAVTTSLTVGTYNTVWTVTTGTVDITPDDFIFTSQSAVALNTKRTSNTVTISGLGGPASVSITNGQYSKNGAAETSAGTTVVNGDTLYVTHQSSTSFSTAVTTSLTVGTLTRTFVSTTLASDTTIDPLNFGTAFSQPAGATVGSADLIISGINTSTSITVAGGQYSKNSGAATASAGTLVAGDTLRLIGVASNTPGASVVVTAAIGGTPYTFTIITATAISSNDDLNSIRPIVKDVKKPIKKSVRKTINKRKR